MTDDRPNFRLIFNKDDLLTEKNLKALAAVYRETVKPKKQNVRMHEGLGQPIRSTNSPKKKGN